MNIAMMTGLVALAAAVILVVRTSGRARRLAVVALIAAAADAWLAVRGIESQLVHLVIIQPLALLGAGALSWVVAESKSTVTAATVVALVGAIRLVGVFALG